MSDRRGPQAQAEDRSDLTPAEARAEVEVFMGEGWVSDAGYQFVRAARFNVSVQGAGQTLRAAVDALKAAWRDAVRPWMERAIEAKLDTADVDGYAPDERVIARVLGEDS